MKLTKHTKAQRRSELDERTTDDRPTRRCSICSVRAIEIGEYPQRENLPVCAYHRQEIRKLPEWRFRGINEVEPDHREVVQ